MLPPEDLLKMKQLITDSDVSKDQKQASQEGKRRGKKVDIMLSRQIANEIREKLNPHPAGQTSSSNVPTLASHGPDQTESQREQVVEGVQHKYNETVLFFPSEGQYCHSYCKTLSLSCLTPCSSLVGLTC